MDKESEWTTLLLMFPHLDLDEVAPSYSLIIDLCEHFNRLDRPDLWKDWLSLNLAETGEKMDFSLSFRGKLSEDFGIKEEKDIE